MMFWQGCFCSWLCFVLCELLLSVTSHGVTGTKLRWLHLPRHKPTSWSSLLPWLVVLWLPELMSCSYTASLPVNWSSLPAPPQVCSSHEDKQPLTASLFHFGIDPPPLLLIQPPKWHPTSLDISGYWVGFTLNSVPGFFPYNSSVAQAQCFSQVSHFSVQIHSECAIWIIIYAYGCIFCKLNFNYSKQEYSMEGVLYMLRI